MIITKMEGGEELTLPVARFAWIEDEVIDLSVLNSEDEEVEGKVIDLIDLSVDSEDKEK